jgi:hypothetical protein
LDITTQPGGVSTYSAFLIFAPGPPLSGLPEGQVCIDGLNQGILDTGGSSNAIGIQVPNGDPVPYSIGQVVEVCEGECCYEGNYTKRCEYALNESTGIWELIGSDNQRTNSCDLDFKCSGGSNKVYQIHQFETEEQRDNYVCPINPIGPENIPDLCYGEFTSSSSSDGPMSESSSSEPAGPSYAGTKPAVNITLTYASGGPYNYLGEIWGTSDSGVTKSVEASSYSTSTSPYNTGEEWANQDVGLIANHFYQRVSLGTPGTTNKISQAYWIGTNYPTFGTFVYTGGLASHNMNTADVALWPTGQTSVINNVMFGTFKAEGGIVITSNGNGPMNGVTVKMERGPDGSVDAWKV